MWPRTPYSPPELPTSTMPLTASGATVALSPARTSAKGAVPDRAAGRRLEREQVPGGGDEEDLAVRRRHAAVDVAAAQGDVDGLITNDKFCLSRPGRLA